MITHDDIKHYWDENAENWFYLSQRGIDIWRDEVNTPAFLDLLPDIHDKIGLDIGCGDGHNSRLIAQRCGKLIALDISEKMLHLAKQHDNPDNITWVNINSEKIPFPSGYFDFVVATMSLMDIMNLETVLAEVHRVLSSDGFFQFSIVHPCFNEFKGKWVSNENNIVGFLMKDYFAETKGEIHRWQHAKSPPNTPLFNVPRFLRPLNEWLNILINAGFKLITVCEPSANDKAIQRYPELNSTRIVAHSLIMRLKKDEQKLSLHKIIEKLPGNVWWKDQNLRYLGCNDHVLNVLGFTSRKELVGKTDYDLWPEQIAQKLEQADRQVLASDEIIQLEETIIEVSGRHAVMSTNKSPLRDNYGSIIGILGVSTDITKLTHTQQQLKKAETRIESMRALSAGIAHELRTPLAAIQFGISGTKSYLPALINAYTLAKQHQLAVEPIQSKHIQILAEMIDNIEAEVRYAETIINMILMNVKQHNISTTSFMPINMSASIEEALRRYPFKPGEAEFVHNIPGNDFIFYGDKTLMVHILFNLLKNALYYLQAAKKGSITLWCEQRDDANILYIKDTGMGISPEILPHLFKKFYTTTHHGTGLGLAFCKMVMESFGGTIHCTSVYGEFTQFELVFPRTEETKPTS